MILHLSNALIQRLKCAVSLEGKPIVQTGRLDAWSGHTFRLGRIEHIILMNDASLYRGIPCTGHHLTGGLAECLSAAGGIHLATQRGQI